jgi:hypothetical protein
MPQHITIPRGTIELAADLHLPDVAEIIHSLERAHFIRERFTGPYR